MTASKEPRQGTHAVPPAAGLYSSWVLSQGVQDVPLPAVPGGHRVHAAAPPDEMLPG